jgi:hypothetical protein
MYAKQVSSRRALGRIASSWLVGAGMAALFGTFAPSYAQAQDPPPPAGRIIIRTPEGEHVIDLDVDQLSPEGEGNQMVAVRVGPDGQVMTYVFSPDAAGGLNGPKVLGPNGLPLMTGLPVIDPGRSYVALLIQRDDVQAHLYLTPRQREALNALTKSQQEALQQQVSQDALAMRDNIRGKSPEEIREFMTEHARKIREQKQNLDAARDQKLAAILTAAQITRLNELDKQWRGPLAMGVKEVGEQVSLTKEQSPVVADLLKQYRQEAARQQNFGFRTAPSAPQSGAKASTASNDTPPLPSTPAEMQVKLEQAKKEIEKARKALGDKALNTLTPEQRRQWNGLTGKPFPFRSSN